MYDFKWKHSFLLEEFHYILLSLLALLIAVLIHELGHYVAALYYGLNPNFSINLNAIYVETSVSNQIINGIVNHAGPIANLIVGFTALIFLFMRGHTCGIRDYFCFLLFLITITNLLVALISLILFSFSGIL